MFAIITPGADPRRGRRAHEVLGVRRLHLRCGCCSCTARSPTWSGAAAGSSRPARSTSRAASSSTCRAASRRSSRPSWSASARGFGKEPMPPHSLPLCLIGAGLLWAGWFGFNAGSALSRHAARRDGVPQHDDRRLDRDVRVGADRVDPPRQAHRARRRHGRRRRPRRHHARLRQREPDGRHRRRLRRRGDLLRGGDVPEAGASATTTRSTRSASTGSAAPGARWRRASSRRRSAAASRRTRRRSWSS